MVEHGRTIGIRGAGRVGTAVARQAPCTGYDARTGTARDPADVGLAVEVMAPRRTGTVARHRRPLPPARPRPLEAALTLEPAHP
ncbi:MAG: hypothetical protein ACYC1Z_06295 [Georgenia sp.]